MKALPERSNLTPAAACFATVTARLDGKERFDFDEVLKQHEALVQLADRVARQAIIEQQRRQREANQTRDPVRCLADAIRAIALEAAA